MASPLLGVARPTTTADPYAPTPADLARAQAIRRAWDAYNGVFHGGDEQWPLLWEKGREPNPNVIVNRCGPAADTDVSWLFGESVGISLPNAPADAQEYLDHVWGVSQDQSSDDDKMALLQELATNGAVTGHAFLKIVWEEDSGQRYPELVVLDSSMVRVRTAPHNAKVPICYLVEYACPDPQQPGTSGTFRQVTELVDRDGQQQLTGRSDPDDTWTITDYFKPANSEHFLQQGDPRTWPYPWSPIEGCAHLARPNAYWGRPRLTPDVIHTNEVLCRVASNRHKIGLAHGHPVLYTVSLGNTQGEIRHKPGTILKVASDIKAVEASGALPELAAEEQDRRADMDEQTHIPSQAFGRITTQGLRLPQSGVAIRLGYGSLVADVMRERRTYGALVVRVSQHLLELRNPAWADQEVQLTWQDPLPSDDLQQAQYVQVGVLTGLMSKQTGAEKLGLDWETERDRMEEEDQASAQAFSKGQGMPPGTTGGDMAVVPPGQAPHVPVPPGQPGAQPASGQQAAAMAGLPGGTTA